MRKLNTIENGADFAACKMGKLDAACVRYGVRTEFNPKDG